MPSVTFGSVHPSDVLDMPVDPNEPTYCLCHQVSYGEMIGCDNPDVRTLLASGWEVLGTRGSWIQEWGGVLVESGRQGRRKVAGDGWPWNLQEFSQGTE